MNRPEPKVGENAPKQDEPQAQDKAADVANEVSSKLDEKPDPKVTKGAPPGSGGPTLTKARNAMSPDGPSRPSMIKANDADHKPKPNLSNTAGFWYDDKANNK